MPRAVEDDAELGPMLLAAGPGYRADYMVLRVGNVGGRSGMPSASGPKGGVPSPSVEVWKSRRCLRAAIGVCIALMMLVAMGLLVKFLANNIRFGHFSSGPCPNAAVAVEKLKLLDGSRARWSVGPLAKAQAVLNNATLEDAERIGMAYTADDMNAIADCENGGRQPNAPFLEERQKSESGLAMVEGDVAQLPSSTKTPRPLRQLWENGTLRYCFAPTCTSEAKVAWKEALAHTKSQVPCLQFHEVGVKYEAANSAAHSCEVVPSVFVAADKSDGCWSYVGQVSGSSDYLSRSQPLNLGRGCETLGMAAHQLGHVLGMFHEHSRPDRGNYVYVSLDKFQYAAVDNFATREEAYSGSTYDIMSLMHGSASAFSKTGEITMEPNDRKFTPFIGQRMGFSRGDVSQLADLYNCKGEAAPGIANADLLADLGERLEKLQDPWTKRACLCEARFIHWGPICDNPNHDPDGPSCTTRGSCYGKTQDYCRPSVGPVAPTTKRGCQCRHVRTSACATEANGLCCNSNYSPFGAWCYTVTSCFGADYDYCVPLTPRDCAWSEWSTCSVSCGEGHQTRFRSTGHQQCVGDRNETRHCGAQCLRDMTVQEVVKVPVLDHGMSPSSSTLPRSTLSGDVILSRSAGAASITSSETTSAVTTTTTVPTPVQVAARIRWTANPGKCLGVHQGLAQSGSAAQIWDCDNSAGMTFLLFPGGTGRIQWRLFPDLCLSTSDGSELQWRDCEGTAQEKLVFILPAYGSGPIRRARYPDRCIHVPKGIANNGVRLQLDDCGRIGEMESRFQLEFVDCVWGSWSQWSQCSSKCGGGRRGRSSVARGGEVAAEICGGHLSQFAACNPQPCAVAGAAKMALELQPIDLQANSAYLRLLEDPRKCLAGHESHGITLQDCADDPSLLFTLPAAGVGPISWKPHPERCLEWSENHDLQLYYCDSVLAERVSLTVHTGGGGAICASANPNMCLAVAQGNKVGVRDCGDLHEKCAHFIVLSVDCSWRAWNAWSACSATCGGGVRTRSRRVDADKAEACAAGLMEEATSVCATQICH